MSAYGWEVAAAVRADVGEGPAWDGRDGVLWFVDVTPGDLYRLDPVSGQVARRSVALPTGAVIPSATGGLVLAMEDGVHTYSWDDTNSTLVVPLEADDHTVRMNDAKCDPRGRLWGGTMAYDYAPGRSTLYSFTPSGPVAVAPGCTIANGTGWSPDGSRMYFIDTATGRIDVFDYDLETGAAAGRRPWVAIDHGDGSPDGMTVDSEGGVWVALWGGSAVRRYSPDGELVAVVDLPVTQAASVCFGGSSLTELYVTTAAYELSATELDEQPLAGATFVVATDVVGSPTVAVDPVSLGLGS
ncbi:SMP-30/gluconolactonase/LRE family protein [Kineosporia sp. A_224]|uniref:SMP-30/gluconolactonase/LRE family protein n=1 Tax=Kineosporia sp. A_224 TaxID=1962180 RepID=UPI000B4B9BBD|nr:SMP-30/gluconolactonase/LRE family protein [Kineosporia sp. A_224]